MKNIVFFDLEVENQSHIRDIGAWYSGAHFHGPDMTKFLDFITIAAAEAPYICGHNIFNHDIPTLEQNQVGETFLQKYPIDTLYLSALIFPQNPYHKLVKDYKLVSEEPNNPVSDNKRGPVPYTLYRSLYLLIDEFIGYTPL